MNMQDTINYCKSLRHIGCNKFKNVIILNVEFDIIFAHLNYIENIIGYNSDDQPLHGKPRFNCLHPDTHCDYPVLSNDDYLVGFTDPLYSNGFKFKFANGAGYGYLQTADILNDSIEFISFGNKDEFNNLKYKSQIK